MQTIDACVTQNPITQDFAEIHVKIWFEILEQVIQ